MTPEQWQRVTRVFDEARALPVDEREAFLARACADEPQIRAEVLSLLAADRDDAFLERGAQVQPMDLLDAAGGPDLAPGASFGPYVIDRLLARGGMGVLYVALDPRLGRRVTLKVLPSTTARDPRARARLQREARTAAALRHPHIVSVHALEEIGQALVIVAEYVEGPTLAQVIAEQGPLPRDRWLQVATALADALSAAHAAQVIHRDVKSSNVVLGRDGLRLVDFGIALGDSAAADTRVTQAGQFAGTPLAVAPEQLEGAPATALSDQFAFGLVLYEAASGRLPFGDGAIAAVWARMLRDQPTPLAAVAPQLTIDDVALVHRTLSRMPADRFGSMDEVLAALRANAFASTDRSSTATAPEDTAPAGTRRWLDVHQAMTAILYVGLLWPGWLVAATLAGRWRASAHLALVCLAASATSLRLHLWFSARQYPEPVAAARRRLWPVLTALDVVYAGLLATLAMLAAEVRLVPAVVTAGLAVCLLMASLVIEPATRRAEEQ